MRRWLCRESSLGRAGLRQAECIVKEETPDFPRGFRDTLSVSSGDGYTHILKDILDRAIKTGVIRTDLTAGTLCDLIYGGIEHVAWSAILRGEAGTLDITKLTAGIAAAFLRGIGLQDRPTASDQESRLRRIETKLGL